MRLPGEGDDARFPTVSRWLKGSKPAHSLRYGEPDIDFFSLFAPHWEEILSTLERVGPDRLGSRRRRFRRDVENNWGLRVELLVGYLLARDGLHFEFGPEGGAAVSSPDLLVFFDDESVAIEVTSRSPEGLAALIGEMERDLAEFPVRFQLQLASWTRLRRDDRREAIETLRLACLELADARGELQVELPILEGRALLTSPAAMEILVFGSQFRSDIGAAEVVLADAVNEKGAAARDGDWPAHVVLVVDLANAGFAASSRPPGVWAGVLQELVATFDDLPFVAIAVVTSSLTSVKFQGAMCLVRRGDPEVSSIVVRLANALGLVLAPDCR